jgi:hypothetical protein
MLLRNPLSKEAAMAQNSIPGSDTPHAYPVASEQLQLKWPGWKTDRSLPSKVEIMNVQKYTLILTYVFMAWSFVRYAQDNFEPAFWTLWLKEKRNNYSHRSQPASDKVGTQSIIKRLLSHYTHFQSYKTISTTAIQTKLRGVRERTIPAKRPPLVGKVSANFCG